MKKIYTKVVVDIESGKVLEEDFYYSNEPCAECKGDVNVPPPPPKTQTEKDVEMEYLKSLKSYNERMANPEKFYTENEKLLAQYTTEELKNLIGGMPAQKEYQQKMMDYTTKLVDYNLQQLANVQTAKELSSYTGALSAEEKTMLDKVAQNATAKITSSVNEATQPIVEGKIAELMDRGVLQGDVGQRLLKDVAESAQKAIAQGSTDVETARMQQELSIQQANKDRALNWANYGLNQQQIFSGMAGQNYAQLQQPLQNATQQTQYSAGLNQQYGNMGTTGQGQWLGLQSQERGAEANRAMQAAIATGTNQANVAAGQWGAAGSVAGMTAMAAIIA